MQRRAVAARVEVGGEVRLLAGIGIAPEHGVVELFREVGTGLGHWRVLLS